MASLTSATVFSTENEGTQPTSICTVRRHHPQWSFSRQLSDLVLSDRQPLLHHSMDHLTILLHHNGNTCRRLADVLLITFFFLLALQTPRPNILDPVVLQLPVVSSHKFYKRVVSKLPVTKQSVPRSGWTLSKASGANEGCFCQQIAVFCLHKVAVPQCIHTSSGDDCAVSRISTPESFAWWSAHQHKWCHGIVFPSVKLSLQLPAHEAGNW